MVNWKMVNKNNQMWIDLVSCLPLSLSEWKLLKWGGTRLYEPEHVKHHLIGIEFMSLKL